MIKYNSLLSHISNEYSIKQGKTEETLSWKARLIYSLLGRMAIASLSDGLEEGPVTIVHLKRRIHNVYAAYYSMYPELKKIFPESSESLEQEIYDIFLKTGIVYHKPDRILMSSKCNSVCKGIKFTRGYSLDSKQMLSGLGSYLKQNPDENSLPVSQMFGLEDSSLTERWKYYTSSRDWTLYEPDNMTQYLKTEPPFSRGYWVDKPDDNGKISLLRTGFIGGQLYYLYRVENKKLYVSQLPQWQVEDYNYRSIANACLAYNGTLPPVTYRIDGNLTYVSFKYLPPSSDLYLWKLFSWPKKYSELPCDFNRILESSVFEALKETLAMQGYEFTKE